MRIRPRCTVGRNAEVRCSLARSRRDFGRPKSLLECRPKLAGRSVVPRCLSVAWELCREPGVQSGSFVSTKAVDRRFGEKRMPHRDQVAVRESESGGDQRIDTAAQQPTLGRATEEGEQRHRRSCLGWAMREARFEGTP